jgi:aryl-alcohol dehydrogenase-like predicted oxidoreductase
LIYQYSFSQKLQLLVFSFVIVDLAEVCHPNNCNIGLLAYSPLASGVLTGKYLDASASDAKSFRLNLFPGYMQRYNSTLAQVYALEH